MVNQPQRSHSLHLYYLTYIGKEKAMTISQYYSNDMVIVSHTIISNYIKKSHLHLNKFDIPNSEHRTRI